MKKQLLILMAALSVAGTAAGVSLSLPSTSEAKAEASAVSFDFTDTMDGAAFKAPASNYGWKVTKGALAPDNSLASAAQIGYLEQAIALNEKKYISLDFYASACPMDIMLLPYAETVNPWVETGIGVHCMASGWLRLDTYIDANKGWLADYTGIGNGADGYAHKLEITSDGTNLTFKIDGVDAFTSATVAIPADSVQLVLRAPAGSYIDNLYIGAEKPADVATAVDVDFTNKVALNDFTTLALNGWTGDNGKFHPADAGAVYNASAVKYNTAIDLTGTKYISFDFYAAEKQFDVALLDITAPNIWGNSLTVHLPNQEGNYSVTKNIDVGDWLGGVQYNLADGKAHTMEMFVANGKVSYKVDGVTPTLDTGATEFPIPSNSAYLVFRAIGMESYIDNLYIADMAPTGVDYDFESVKDADAFTAWNSVGWTAANGGFVANTNWATTQMKQALDLTKNQEIFFDVYLSSSDTDKQFNVGFYSEADLPTANTSQKGKTYSLGSTLFLGKSFGRNDWIADVGAELYNDTWHSVKITVENGQMSIAVDGVAYDILTTAIPADTAYLLLQSTNTANVLDNFKIVVEESGETPDPTPATYTVTFKNWNGDVLQSGAVAEGEMPVYAGETPMRAEDDFNTYAFKGWDKEFSAVTGDVEYVAQFEATAKEPPVMEALDLDFSAAAHADNFVAYGGSAGWSVSGGVFKPNADWATVNTGKVLDLTKDQQITFDVYLSSSEAGNAHRQFNVGFFATTNADTNTQAGSGVNYSLGATMYYGSSFGRTQWVADVAANLYNDSVHAVKVTVQGGKLSVSVDGTAYDTLTADIPAEKVFLLLQSTSTATYVDNLKIGEIVEEVNPYEGIFEKYGSSAGWAYKNEKYVPNAEWATFNTVNTLDLTKNQEITFDVYLSEADADKQFNVGFFETKVEETNMQAGTGLCFSFGATIWVSTNFGRNGWASECVKNYYDNSVHSVKLTIVNKEITLSVDGEVLYFLTNGDSYTPTLTVDSAYLLMQATSTETYVQNYTVQEVAAAPKTYTVTFKNWNGDVLQSGSLEEGSMPVYTGATPVKPADEDYTYTFKGWDQEIVAVTGNVEYVAQFDATEIDKLESFTVTFKNWDGETLQSADVLEGTVPAYTGATPEKPADEDYTYAFSGWDKELSAVTGDVEYVAQFTATPIPKVETVDELQLGFEDDAYAEHLNAIANDGWTAKDGKYYPAQAGALYNSSAVQTLKAIDLTATKYISLDFCSTAKTFDIGFLDVSAINMWGNALFIHLPFSDGTIGVNTYVDCTAGQYLGGSAINVMDGAQHNLKIVVDGGKVSYVLDGVTILEGYDVPSAKAYLVIRAVGEESYIDNLIISNEDIEYIPPVVDNSYEEAELDFTAELDGSKYFTTLDSNGWAVKDGYFMPEYMPWSSTYLSQPVDMSGEKYISFDFLAVKDNFDATQSQFNIMFLTDLKKFTCSGAIHCFMESTTPVLTVNRAMGKDKWVGTASFNWADGKMHNMMIIIKDGTIKFEVDGQPVLDNQLGTQIVIELTDEQQAKETYFGLQATNVMTRIDNFKVKNTYTEYVAPTPEEEIAFEELEQSFVAGEETGFVQYNDSVNWTVNADGQFAPSTNWAKAYLDKQIPLTQEKTVTMKLCLSTAESGHQFTVGFSMDKNSYYGVYLVFYQGTVSLNYGTAPQVRLITQTNNVWYDGEEHVLKMIVKNEKLAILIDGEVIFKDVQVAMDSGYLTVQSSTTQDWIDDLTIINDAEPLSKPQPDGDIATPPVDGSVNNQVSGEVVEKSKGCSSFMGVAICPLTLAAAAVLVAKKKNKKE